MRTRRNRSQRTDHRVVSIEIAPGIRNGRLEPKHGADDSVNLGARW